MPNAQHLPFLIRRMRKKQTRHKKAQRPMYNPLNNPPPENPKRKIHTILPSLIQQRKVVNILYPQILFQRKHKQARPTSPKRIKKCGQFIKEILWLTGLIKRHHPNRSKN